MLPWTPELNYEAKEEVNNDKYNKRKKQNFVVLAKENSGIHDTTASFRNLTDIVNYILFPLTHLHLPKSRLQMEALYPW